MYQHALCPQWQLQLHHNVINQILYGGNMKSSLNPTAYYATSPQKQQPFTQRHTMLMVIQKFVLDCCYLCFQLSV